MKGTNTYYCIRTKSKTPRVLICMYRLGKVIAWYSLFDAAHWTTGSTNYSHCNSFSTISSYFKH